MHPHHLPMLNLRQLHYFVALADHGSISAAAAALGIAQPSLSENIAKLERVLEVRLVIRGSRGVQLTEAGKRLAVYGREMRQGAASIVEELRQLSADARGPVSVGLTPSSGVLMAVPMIETLQVEHPQIRLHIAEGMTGDLINWVLADRLDMALGYDIAEHPDLSSRPVLEEKLFLVTAPDNWPIPALAEGRAPDPVDLEDLARLPLVLPSSNHVARRMVDNVIKAQGIRLNVISDVDSLPQIVEMVARASAYTILPHAAVAQQVAAGTLAVVGIVNPTITRTAYLIRKRSRAISRASAVVEATMAVLLGEMIERYKLQNSLHLYPS